MVENYRFFDPKEAKIDREASYYNISADFDADTLRETLKDNGMMALTYGISEDNFRLYLTAGYGGHGVLKLKHGELSFGGHVDLYSDGDMNFYHISGGTFADVPQEKQPAIEVAIMKYIENILGDKNFKIRKSGAVT